jgi:hypothetical protein
MLSSTRTIIALACSLGAAGCGAEAPLAPGATGTYHAGEEAPSLVPSAAHANAAVEAQGTYHFTIPADFNGGIFGIAIDNHVSFVARRAADGGVTGRFRYVQAAGGERAIFSGTVTCLSVQDTPVLARFPETPAAAHNRAKWGGLVEESTDPGFPAGTYIWFQSIDNDSGPGAGYPDVSTLSGFGNEAANEAFCASPNVPNPNFGPHAVGAGQIIVR